MKFIEFAIGVYSEIPERKKSLGIAERFDRTQNLVKREVKCKNLALSSGKKIFAAHGRTKSKSRPTQLCIPKRLKNGISQIMVTTRKEKGSTRCGA